MDAENGDDDKDGWTSAWGDDSRQNGLRSAVTSNYVEPRLCTKFGEKALSFAGPHAWNQLRAPTACTT